MSIASHLMAIFMDGKLHTIFLWRIFRFILYANWIDAIDFVLKLQEILF